MIIHGDDPIASSDGSWAIIDINPQEELGKYRTKVLLWQWILVLEGKLKVEEISLKYKY